MRKFFSALAIAVLLAAPVLAQNAASSSPRVQGTPDGYGDPVQVTVVSANGGTATGPVTPVTDNSGSLTVDCAGAACATAAKQPALGTAGTASADVITVQGIASGTAVATSLATLPALTTGSAVIGVTGVAQASTTSGQSGPLAQGAVTTSAPTYVTTQTSPLSLDTAGNLRVGIYQGGNIANITNGGAADGGGYSTQGLVVFSVPQLFNGSTWDRARDVAGAVATTGVGVMAVEEEGRLFSHLAANATTTVKSGAGFLHTLSVNTKGLTNTVTLYDNTAGSGTVIAVIDSTIATETFIYDLKFGTGLTAVIAGGTAADITISYR